MEMSQQQVNEVFDALEGECVVVATKPGGMAQILASGSFEQAIVLIAFAQQLDPGIISAIIDAGHIFDVTLGKTHGVNLDLVLVSQPNSPEEAGEIAEMLVGSGEVGIFVTTRS